jgi:hypothetical protein
VTDFLQTIPDFSDGDFRFYAHFLMSSTFVPQ